MSKYVIFVLLFQMGIAFLQGVHARQKKRELPLEKMAITAFVPVVGLVIPYIGRIFRRREDDGNLADIFDYDGRDIQNDIRYEKIVQVEKEVNYVSVEEALLLNDSTIKRRLIMDTAKEDAYEYINFLKLAMQDRDMETSHYAASIVMEVNRELQNVIQSAVVLYEKDKTDVQNILFYGEIVGRYYNSGLLEEHGARKYGLLYSRLLEELINLEYMTESIFEDKIETDMNLGEHRNLKSWIHQYQERYPESEKPYLLMMKYYYITHDQEGIKKTLEQLQSSHVNVSRKGNERIEFWKSIR